MNSFTFVARGIEAEVARQIGIYESGGEVVQETLHFDPQSGAISSLRSKEEADDYRYFPEPDLVPVEPPAEMVERHEGRDPGLPAERIRLLEPEVGFELAEGLVTSGRDGLYARVDGDRRAVANVVMNQLAATGVDPDAVTPASSPGSSRRATGSRARPSTRPSRGSASRVSPRIRTSRRRPCPTRRARSGDRRDPRREPGPGDGLPQRKEGLLGFFVGQVMKATQGQANPKVVNERLREKLRA